MTSGPSVEWGERHALVYDYDLRRWIRVPEPGSVDEEFLNTWAAGTARAWAEDTGHDADPTWGAALALMLVRAAQLPYSTPPDAVFLHLLLRDDLPPSPALATLLTYPADQPLDDFAGELAEQYVPVSGRSPLLEPAELSGGRVALVVTAWPREEDGSLRIVQHVVWQIHEFMHIVLTMSDDELGRVLAATEDLVRLADCVQLVERPADVPGSAQ